jgi:hypothetical protein
MIRINFLCFFIPCKNEEEYIRIRKQKVLIDGEREKYVMSDAG